MKQELKRKLADRLAKAPTNYRGIPIEGETNTLDSERLAELGLDSRYPSVTDSESSEIGREPANNLPTPPTKNLTESLFDWPQFKEGYEPVGMEGKQVIDEDTPAVARNVDNRFAAKGDEGIPWQGQVQDSRQTSANELDPELRGKYEGAISEGKKKAEETVGKISSAIDRRFGEPAQEETRQFEEQKSQNLKDYMQGMKDIDRRKFLDTIAGNLGKVASGVIGLKGGLNVADKYKYDAYDPAGDRAAAAQKLEAGQKLVSEQQQARRDEFKDLTQAYTTLNELQSRISDTEAKSWKELLDLTKLAVSEGKMANTQFLSPQNINMMMDKMSQEERMDMLRNQVELLKSKMYAESQKDKAGIGSEEVTYEVNQSLVKDIDTGIQEIYRTVPFNILPGSDVTRNKEALINAVQAYQTNVGGKRMSENAGAALPILIRAIQDTKTNEELLGLRHKVREQLSDPDSQLSRIAGTVVMTRKGKLPGGTIAHKNVPVGSSERSTAGVADRGDVIEVGGAEPPKPIPPQGVDNRFQGSPQQQAPQQDLPPPQQILDDKSLNKLKMGITLPAKKLSLEQKKDLIRKHADGYSFNGQMIKTPEEMETALKVMGLIVPQFNATKARAVIAQTLSK